jgi:broad specificity phosphatase PhoE
VTPATQVYLVRHAKAGSRGRWSGPDDLRPLSKAGRRQADALGALLGDRGVTRVVSSPFVRCRQTVVPLAERLRVPVDLADALAEGTPLSEALLLVAKYADQPAVLCTHGDVIGALLDQLAHRGLVDQDFRCEKGSTWVLEFDGDDVTGATYLAPPPLVSESPRSP